MSSHLWTSLCGGRVKCITRVILDNVQCLAFLIEPFDNFCHPRFSNLCIFATLTGTCSPWTFALWKYSHLSNNISPTSICNQSGFTRFFHVLWKLVPWGLQKAWQQNTKIFFKPHYQPIAAGSSIFSAFQSLSIHCINTLYPISHNVLTIKHQTKLSRAANCILCKLLYVNKYITPALGGHINFPCINLISFLIDIPQEQIIIDITLSIILFIPCKLLECCTHKIATH